MTAIRKALIAAIVIALGTGSTSSLRAQSKVGVITLHGVGSQRPGWQFDRQLRKSLNAAAGSDVQVVVKTVYYHTKARDRQRELWDRYTQMERQDGSKLDQMLVRRVLMATIGDALAYSNDPHRKNSLYQVAQSELKKAIDEIEAQDPDVDTLVIVAHSLGCRIVFDYLCDVQDRSGIWAGAPQPTEFQKLSQLRLLVTTGCNLTFFESAVAEDEQKFFKPPAEFTWLNYYDRDDPLGWPLQQLGGAFAEHVQDKERNHIGSVLTSHIGYWGDNRLNNEIADRIVKLAHEN